MNCEQRLHELNRQLSKSQGEIQNYQQQANELENATSSANDWRLQLRSTEKELRSQTKKVKKFENMGAVKSFFAYSLHHNNGREIKRERGVELQDDLGVLEETCKACSDQLDHFDKMVEECRNASALLDFARIDFDKLLANKNALLMQAGPPHIRSQLQGFMKKKVDGERQTELLTTTISSGKQALASLRTVVSQLNSAESWGVADMMGGGMAATMVKRNKINNAKRLATVAKERMANFNRKLRENTVQDVPALGAALDEMRGFSAFADYFLDGFLTDFFVQRQVVTARSSCHQAIQQVSNVLRTLELQVTAVQRELVNCEREQTALVLSFGVENQNVPQVHYDL